MRFGIVLAGLALAATGASAQGVGTPPMVEPLRDSDPYAGADPNTAVPSDVLPDPSIQGLPPGDAPPPVSAPAVAGPPIDVDRVMDGVKKCWTAIPRVYGTPAQGGIARIRLKLQPNGALDGAPMIIDKPLGNVGTKFAESAAKAIERCQPYRLPPERYAEWRQIEMRFDTIDPDNPPPPTVPADGAVPDTGSPAGSATVGAVPATPPPGEPAAPQ